MLAGKTKRISGYVGLARHAAVLRTTKSEMVRERARNHLASKMGKLKGLPQKLGQMLSFSTVESESQARTSYSQLQETGDPLPLDVMIPLMEASWGTSVSTVLDDLDPCGRAGSLGQVHRARTKDGREVAVKVQYPGIRDAIKTDLASLGWLSTPLKSLKQGFDLTAYRSELLRDLTQELDYSGEALRHKRFATWCDPASIVVPRVVDELSSETVLVTEWETGDAWQSVCETWNSTQKRSVANSFLSFFLNGVFENRVMQADWHPGNVRFRYDANGSAQIVLYDLGCTFEPTETECLALLRLIYATIHENESPWPLLLKLGFRKDYLEPMAKKLPALCKVLFEPFCSDAPYDLANWKLSERIAGVLGDDRWNFRIAGPPKLIFLLRAFQGAMFYLKGLKSPVRWKSRLESIAAKNIERFNRLAIESDPAHSPEFSTVARHLCIRVLENRRTRVALTLPVAQIDDLESVLDEDLKQRIDRRGIDLAAITLDVRRRCYAPGTVFAMDESDKRIEIELK